MVVNKFAVNQSKLTAMNKIIISLLTLLGVSATCSAYVPKFSDTIICYLEESAELNPISPTPPKRNHGEQPCCEINIQSGEMTITANGEILSVTITNSTGLIVFQSLDSSGVYDIGIIESGTYAIDVEINEYIYSGEIQV